MGVFVGEDGVVGDKEKTMWDKTLKRGKEFSPLEQPRSLDRGLLGSASLPTSHLPAGQILNLPRVLCGPPRSDPATRSSGEGD